MTHALIETLQPYQENEDLFFRTIRGTFAYTSPQLQSIERADNIALAAHHGRMRATGEEYIHHPRMLVIILLVYLGITDPVTLSIALCHDVDEDHSDKWPIQSVHKEMGREIAEGVNWCNRNRFNFIADETEREHVFLQNILEVAPLRVALVKLADCVHNGVTPWDVNNDVWRNKRIFQIEHYYKRIAAKYHGVLLPELRMIHVALKDRVCLLPRPQRAVVPATPLADVSQNGLS